MALGASVGSAHGSITISTSQAQQAPAVMAGVASGIERNMNRVDASAKKAEKGIGGLQAKFRELDSAIGGTLLVAGIAQLTRMTFELAKASAQADITREAFDSLAAGVGQSSDKLLAAMKESSRGTISESNLILGANRAIISGVADNTKELTQILEIARATGRAFGVDTSDAYSRIVRAVSKLEPELVDELGIVLRLDTVFRAYAAQLGTTAAKLTEAQRRQALFDEIVRQTQPAVDAARKSGDNAADTYDRVGASFDDAKKSAGDLLNTMGGGVWASVFIANVLAVQVEMNRLIAVIQRTQQAWQEFIAGVGLGPLAAGAAKGPSGVPAWMTGVSKAASGPLGPMPPLEERRQVRLDWARDVADLNKQLHEDITSQERDYGRQRADAVEEFQKNITREARDFAIQRQRQEQDLIDGISDIHEDAARRELRMAQDLARGIARAQSDSAERIAEAREDTTERLLELEEDFQKNRQRAAEDHRDKLLSLAGRLDAIGLLEERKRWARENKDAKEAHSDQRDDLKKQLAERIEDENKALAKSIANAKEAHERQLQDAREADARRIADMQADFEKRKTQEDADRATRLKDQAEDHQDQLDEMDRAHGERITQIKRHAQEERTQLDIEAQEALLKLGVRNAAWEKAQEARETHREKLWDKFMKHIDESLEAKNKRLERSGAVREDAYPTYASGGWVKQTGLARVHRGEFVMPAPAVAAASGMGGSRSINIAAGAIVVYGAAGQSEERLAEMVEERVVRLLEAL